jgi:hypothetical protein
VTKKLSRDEADNLWRRDYYVRKILKRIKSDLDLKVQGDTAFITDGNKTVKIPASELETYETFQSIEKEFANGSLFKLW